MNVTRSRVGLAVLGVLSVLDLLLPLLTDGEHPPMAVALAAAAVGLVSLALIVSAWRGAARAVPPLIVLRLLSALSAVPAFFTTDVPTAALAGASTAIVLTVVGVALVVPSMRRATVAASL